MKLSWYYDKNRGAAFLRVVVTMNRAIFGLILSSLLLSASSDPAQAFGFRKKKFSKVEVELQDASGDPLIVSDPLNRAIPPLEAGVHFMDVRDKKVCLDRTPELVWVWGCDPKGMQHQVAPLLLDGSGRVRLSSGLEASGKRQIKLGFRIAHQNLPFCTNLDPQGPVMQEIIAKGIVPEPWWFEGKSGIFGRYRVEKAIVAGLTDTRTGKPCQDLFLNEPKMPLSGDIQVTCRHELTNAQLKAKIAEIHDEECRDDPAGLMPRSYLAHQ